jgi:hypothetical protein
MDQKSWPLLYYAKACFTSCVFIHLPAPVFLLGHYNHQMHNKHIPQTWHFCSVFIVRNLLMYWLQPYALVSFSCQMESLFSYCAAVLVTLPHLSVLSLSKVAILRNLTISRTHCKIHVNWDKWNTYVKLTEHYHMEAGYKLSPLPFCENIADNLEYTLETI